MVMVKILNATCNTGDFLSSMIVQQCIETRYLIPENPDDLTLTTANILVTKENTDTEFTVALKCDFNINHGYQYRVKW